MAWKTMTSNPPDLAQRVEKLEKANRRLKLAGVLALTLVGCLLLLGAASPKRTVEAEAFILRDANGKGRAVLHMKANGPGLLFYDANGEPQLVLSATPEGPMLVLFDANTMTRAVLAVKQNESRLVFFDANEKLIFSAPP